MREIDDFKRDLNSLRTDMDSFCDIYKEDRGVWQGEAATEEVCYISSDIDAFREAVSEIERELDQLAQTVSGVER